MQNYMSSFNIDTIKSIDISRLNSINSLKILGGAAAGLLTIYVCKIWYSYRFFKKRGIKNTKYRFFFGNTPEILEKNYSNCLQEWTKIYGPTYGYFEGHTPILVTSDPEIINEIFIKQFSHFIARKHLPFQTSDNDRYLSSLINNTGKNWKRTRNIINPTFTPAKLKELLPLMNKCSTRLIEVIEKNLNKDINISRKFDCFTMDTIWNTAFGIDIDCQNNSDNLFFIKAVELFRNTVDFTLPFLINTYFCEFKFATVFILKNITFVLNIINNNWGIPLFWLNQKSYQIVEKRISENIKKNDYIQILINSQSEEVDTSNKSSTEDWSLSKYEKKLTKLEITNSIVIFLLAGYETTSTTLSYCMYVLAKHPDEMVKLQEEIDSCIDDLSNLDYDRVQKLEYLDLFIKEVLRLYPIGNNVINRRCLSPCKIKNIDIPIGLTIAVDVLSLHYDADNWGPEDPYKFCPLRHSPEIKRNPAYYMPFGYGPRICVGMRFALLEVKLALIKILKRYQILPSENTPEKLSFMEGFSVRRPKNGISVQFKLRGELNQ